MKLRDHTYFGMTQSLCPECLSVVPAKIITRKSSRFAEDDRDRVYFRKSCPEHGVREDFVCSDVRWFDRLEHSTPGKFPLIHGVQPLNGCPLDCGLCTEHEQHTCIALFEITSSCNLTCPMCFAGSAPGGKHVPLDQCKAAIDRLVEVEGKPEVLQLSGGEPTIHPKFLQVLEYACAQPIDIVMINTNGIRFAKDPCFLESVAKFRKRVEIYFQFDGFDDEINEQLRGESLLQSKLDAIDALRDAGLNVTLVCTLQAGINEHQVGDIVRFGLERPHITGVSFQPATYSGRYFLPEQLESRITFPDVIDMIASQASDVFEAGDFLPLPCAHPNGHTLTYAYRTAGEVLPLNRFIDIESNMDLLANGIVFTRDRARDLISEYLARSVDCSSSGCDSVFDLVRTDTATDENSKHSRMASEFFEKAAAKQLNQSDLLRITVTSFMDAYNFDVRQVMKSCVHHLLPSGHLIPFSAYNVLYRDGHVPMPPLVTIRTGQSTQTESAQNESAQPESAQPESTNSGASAGKNARDLPIVG